MLATQPEWWDPLLDFNVNSAESWIGLLGVLLTAYGLVQSRGRLADPAFSSRLWLRVGLVLLVLLSTYLAFRVPRFEMWATLIAGGVVAVVLTALDFLPTWLASRRAQQLAEQGLSGTLADAGSFRLVPYSSSARDRKAYQRPDGVQKKVLEWIVAAPSPLLFLTGRSGSGKSSLLAAYVLPALKRRQKEPWATVLVRAYDDPAAEMAAALRRPGVVWELGSVPEVLEARPVLELACSHLAARSPSQRLLIVIDQFEEFLTLCRETQRTALESILRSVVESPIPGLTVLLALRSDYLGRLEDLRLPRIREGGLDNWVEISAFSEAQGRELLTRSGLEIGPELLDDVLQEATEIEETPGLVRPITLNLMGIIMDRSVGRLPRGFRAHGLIAGYLKEVAASPNLWPATPQILRSMLPREGARQPRTVAEMARATGLRTSAVRGILLRLGNRGLVRSLDARSEIWEISHDFLARPLRALLAQWEMGFWRRLRPWLAPAMLGIWLVATLYALPAVRTSLILHKIGPLGAQVTRGDDLALRVEVRQQPLDLAALVRWLRWEENPIDLDVAAHFFADRPREDVADLGALRHLRQLRSLDIGYTDVVDLTPLSSLDRLVKLDLFRSKVTDLTPLSSLTQLEELSLLRAKAVDLRPLATLINLKSLNLHQTEVSDITPLCHLKSLRELYLGETKVSDLEALRHLDQLEDLYLSDTQVTNLEPLGSLPRLETLSLEWTPVSDLQPLSSLPRLRSLSLVDTHVIDLSPLMSLPRLESVDLGFEAPPSLKAQAEQLKQRKPNLDIR